MIKGTIEPSQVYKRQFGMATCVDGGGGTCLNAPSRQLRHPELDCLLLPKTSFCAKWPIRAGSINVNEKSIDRLRIRSAMTSNAFTLAEVLVTLGIIGVVSAMTVPSLMQNYQRQSYVTQLHKVYNELNQVFMQYMNDNNAVNLIEAGVNSQQAVNDMVPKYFKIIQTCSASLNPCFPATTTYKKMSGAALASSVYVTQTSYVLASGASVRFNYTGLSGDRMIHIMVDVNGQKGPNILGRDLFTLAVYKDGQIDDEGLSAPLSETARNTQYAAGCGSDTASNVYGCFGRILNDNWQMTY